MVVEWARSCYSSRWHLFQDSLGTETAGRYYFSPAGSRHYPFAHNLGSRSWHDSNWQHELRLGESLDAAHIYYAGTSPVIAPQDRIVGKPECVKSGEKIADAAIIGDLVDGFPSACFIPPETLPDLWFEVGTINRCIVQKIYAVVIDWLYVDDEERIIQALTDWLGAAVTISVHGGTPFLPAVVTIIHPEFSVIILDGTRNFQQFALQALYAQIRPTNIGIFGTNRFWYSASTWATAWLENDGADPAKPILLVGHSYGGAVAQILAARYRAWRPEREIRYLTYGSPKPGDQRLIDLLRQCQGISLANDNDIVTVLPPDRLTLIPVVAALALPVLFLLENWKRPANQLLLREDGSAFTNESVLLDFDTLLAIMIRVIAQEPLDVIIGHSSGEYVARLSRRCPDPAWPIDAEVNDLLDYSIGAIGFTGIIIGDDLGIEVGIGGEEGPDVGALGIEVGVDGEHFGDVGDLGIEVGVDGEHFGDVGDLGIEVGVEEP